MSNFVSNIPKIPKIVLEKFRFLESNEREYLFSKAIPITLEKEQVLSRQGDPSDSFFVILTGALRATKHLKNKKIEHVLTYRKAGDIVGEISLTEDSPFRTVTLKATQPTTLLKFPVSAIKENTELYNKISQNFFRKTATRLRFLTEVTVRSMEKQLQENRKRSALGLLMITVLTLICIYVLSLPFLASLQLHLPVTTIISAPLVLILVVVMIMVMKKSGFPYRTFGLSTKNWRRYSAEALLFSIPIILVLMAVKWVMIHLVLKQSGVPFFDPKVSVPGHFSWMLYFITLIIYIIISPGQELIVRGALQTGFYIFLPGRKKKRLWTAIFISNLIFSIPHLYSSPYFALVVLAPGIFWGWLYARQKTLIGVSVSHVFIGIWMIFIVGFEQLLRQLGTFF